MVPLWIWQRIPPLLLSLGCPPQNSHELLDFYHVTEYLQAFAEAAFTNRVERQTWFKQARKELKQGRVTNLLERMQVLRNQMSGESRRTITAQIAYLTKGHQHRRLNYSKIAAMKLPIGSGTSESLMRQVVNLRLKGAGKFWLKEHAEIILHARCQSAAGTWSTFCDSILTSRLYPA